MVVSQVTWLPWTWALMAAAALALTAILLRTLTDGHARGRGVAAVTTQVAVLLALYAAWQYAGSISLASLDGAEEAGRWLSNLETTLHWPSEAAIQAPVLDHDWMLRAADTYYAVAHVPVFLATLVWVLARHRADWPFVRTTIVLTTGGCLLIQYLPVAPPRLIPELGVVDTAARTGLSVYATVPGANQYAAMPSVHVAWAAAVAFFIIIVARSRWRWFAIAYPVATMWVVIVTGNHFTIDGVAAVAILAAAAAAANLWPSQRPSRATH